LRVVSLPERNPTAAIEAALRLLPRDPRLPDAAYQTHLESARRTFFMMWQAHRARPETPARFLHSNRTQTGKQLAAGLKPGWALVRAIDAMRMEAIVALADNGFLEVQALHDLALRFVAAGVNINLSKVPTRLASRASTTRYAKAVAGNAGVF
jgi:hypothetical protein